MGRSGDVWGYVADELEHVGGREDVTGGWLERTLSRVRQCSHRAQRAGSEAIRSREVIRAMHYLMQIMVASHGHAEAARILRTHLRAELRRNHHAV